MSVYRILCMIMMTSSFPYLATCLKLLNSQYLIKTYASQRVLVYLIGAQGILP